LDLFPYEIWARLLARRARQSLPEHAFYQSQGGYAPLREAIAAHVAVSRGVRCTPDQVILTAGTQGAIDLAVRALVDPGDVVWVENPGHFGALGALLVAGAQLVPVPVDAQGMDVEAGRQRAPEARLISTSPTHQFPTGVTMSLDRRLALLDLARETGVWILEDDYDSDYRFSERPLPALQGLDRANRVLYVGTFSKVLFPALRLGYLIAPLDLIDPLLATRRFIDVHVPILEQMTLADFMEEGHFADHLRRMTRLYLERRDCLVEELRAHLGGLLEVSVPLAGMQLIAWLPPEKDDHRASALAAQAGIAAAPVSRYCLEPPPRGGLVFGYAGVDEEVVRRAVGRLAVALEGL
jgi:GntR family transcriptional regulator/MocR family aminotransferase